MRVCGVHAIDFGGLEDELGANLGAAQGRRRVGGEKRIAGAGGKHHHLAFFQVLQRLGAHIRLNHLLDGDGRHHARCEPLLVHGVRQRQCIHHRSQHAHVVGCGTVHAFGTARDPAKDISPANHHRHLNAHAGNFRHLAHHAHDGGAVDAERVVAHQRLARQLEQDALIGRRGGGHGFLS